MPDGCPLCASMTTREALASNAWAVALLDGFPVSPGHALIVSRRHVASLFDLSPQEQAERTVYVGDVGRHSVRRVSAGGRRG